MPSRRGASALSLDGLREALDRVERANDMLPPREDDKIAGRIAARFVDGLHARIAAGHYRCAPAAFVPVPKRRLTTRPAAVLSLKDRVVFEALVAQARPRLARYLASEEVVLWPRADDSAPKWNQFERSPVGMGGGWVVSADVAGFYESVDHIELGLTLADAGVGADLREAILEHLGDLMLTARGLPQGVETSDTLATAYLASVDGTLQRLGLTFWRHGDDYRIWAQDYADALRAIFELEQALRQRGLLLSGGKLMIEKLGNYAGVLSDVDQASERFKARMRAAREEALLEATEEELAEAIEAAGIDEDMQWRFWYHHTLDLADMIEALAPSLTPKPIEVVAEMLRDLMSAKPKEALPANLAHARLTFCLRRLARARSAEALPWVGELLVRRPDEVQDLANYMLAVVDAEPDRVVAACQYALTQKTHMLDWERAWIYRVLSRAADRVSRAILRSVKSQVESDASNWLLRVEGLRLLARAGSLSQRTASQIARTAPESFRGDIAGVIAMIEEPGTWTARYLDGARQDALEAVVIDGVRDKMSHTRS